MSRNRKSRKSGNWAGRQNRDQFVKAARQQGLRARSAFKLDEIDKKYRLIKTATRIVDLGCSPGSWCQYAVSRVPGPDQVLGVDLLPMQALENVSFIHGDFTQVEIQEQIRSYFGDHRIDLVLSDMAPNITGIRVTDQARAESLQESILEFCLEALNPGGKVLTKLFEGESMQSMRRAFEATFDHVQMVKPDASRSESREIYLLARGFTSQNSNKKG
jgi:23S rRNA (uridine2552-2'-O)-methyltransferase